MAKIEQWVNLPKDKKFAEDGITLERCGKLSVELTFEKDDIPVMYKAKVTPVGSDNAVYSDEEKKRNPNFKLTQGTIGISDKKTITLEDIQLPAAGGNKYKIEVKDDSGNVVSTSVEVETRRKLYYQVVKMKDMKATISILTSHLEDEFWSPSKKHYIKLKQIKSKGDISGYSNFDVHQQDEIPALTKKNYSTNKDPFCFVVTLVDQMAASGRKKIEELNLTIKKGKPISVLILKDIWLNLDKPDIPEAKWLFSAKFVEDTTGKIFDLINYVTPDGKHTVKVDTSNLPDKAKGKIELDVKIVDRFRTGLSFNKNLICIATRVFWEQRIDGDMKQTLVHEAGHKIGMVANGKGKLPKKQTTHYYMRGDHCNSNINTCVMYESIHPNVNNRFCSVCNKSIAKLDLDASQLPGFTPL